MLNFKQIVGHKDIIEHFKATIVNNKVSHAYLISGEEGSGKKTLVEAFAMALQCMELTADVKNLNDVDSCGLCISCKQLIGKNHPDIIYVKKGPDNKYTIGIEDIRVQLIEDIAIKPYSSPYKIYIIDNAETLSVEAQNALLKTLEEPPTYAIIFLISNSVSTLLTTIQSRCVMLQVRPIDKALIKAYLMTEYNIPDYQAELSTIFAQGNMGKAIEYSSSDEFLDYKNEALNILKNIGEKDNYELIDIVSNGSKERDKVFIILDLILLWYRDLLMYKVTKDPNLLLYKREIGDISKKAKVISYEGIQNILKSIEETKVKIEANVNVETTLQLMLFTIKENSND